MSTTRREFAHRRQKPATEGLSENLERMLPHSLAAERGLIASVLLDPSVCDDVVAVVRAEDFYGEPNKVLFHAIVEMHTEARAVDITLLLEQLKHAGDLERIGGEAYLAEVMHSEAVPAHAVSYAKVVADKAGLRSLINAGAEIIHDAYESADEAKNVMSQAEQKIFAINEGRSGDSVASMKDILLDAFETIDARLRDGGAGGGIPTGFTDLDNMLGGFHENQLIILAARPAMGKTAFATNIADYVAVHEQKPVLLVSLEMASLELAQRMVCSRGRIDGKKLRNGFASGEDHEAFARTSEELGNSPLYIDDSPSRTVTEIAAVARRLKRQSGLGLIVIDYLQLVSPDNSNDPRQEQVAKIARRLKGLARELKCPILCLAQLNRQAEASQGNIPRLSHLRESGAIEQDADVVMFVHREEYYHQPEEAEEKGLKGKAQIIVAKQRNGPIGNVDLAWLGQYTRFMNLMQEDVRSEYTEFEGADQGF